MKSYRIIREIEQFNENARSAKDIYITTEKGVMKEFASKEEAREYLNNLRVRAIRTPKFESVTLNGKDRFTAHTTNKKYKYIIK